MPDIEKLRDLLARVEAAEGEDKALDEAIWRTLMDKPERGLEAVVGRYTGSIDAAVALVEKVLPGWAINIEMVTASEMLGRASLYPWQVPFLEPDDNPNASWEGNIPLSVCSAALKALIAQQEAAHG